MFIEINKNVTIKSFAEIDKEVIFRDIITAIINCSIKDFDKRKNSIIKRLIDEDKVIMIIRCYAKTFNEKNVSIIFLIVIITIN